MNTFITSCVHRRRDGEIWVTMMRSKIILTVVVLLVLAPSVQSVFAQGNHSLEWGVDIGEQFTYVLQRATYASEDQRVAVSVELPYVTNLDVGQKAQLMVEQLDLIQTQINTTYDMPVSRCQMTRLNDSAVIGTQLQRLLVPIGDWDFLTEIGNITGTPGLTLVDTSQEWGTIGRGTYVAVGGATVSVYIETRYEKENGTLNYMRYYYTADGMVLFDIIFAHWYPGMPTILPEGDMTVTILIVALIGVVGAIAGSLSYKWFKGKKSLAQQLGE